MQKAILVNIDEKTNDRINRAANMAPADRLTYMFALIRLAKKFNPARKVYTASPEIKTYTLSRKK